jgi:hypothetical protein
MIVEERSMKKKLMIAVAALAVLTIALPAFAVEFKYGGYYHVRWQSNNHLTGSNDNPDFPFDSGNPDDNNNYADQRLRMYFDFIASENLQVVTKWEVDTLWGNSFDKFSTGGGVGADSINLEMKNVYVDFAVPYTPVRARLGVQGLAFLTGWIVDDDFSAAQFITKLEPVEIKAGYIGAQNNNVTDERENIDDLFLSVDYSHGPFSASLVGFYQFGHDAVPVAETNGGQLDFVDSRDNHLFDLGVALGFKQDWFDATINYVQNLGSYDHLSGRDDNIDYRGYMIEGIANFTFNPFTFSVGGFLTSGDTNPDDDTNNAFQYPRGRSHYWSEILGLGTLDQNISTSFIDPAKDTHTAQQLADVNKGGFSTSDGPSNLWTINAAAAWQALEKTKFTASYYYIGTQKAVLANFQNGDESSSIGHEIDFYVDQELFDGLALRLVGAYLFANEGYTVFSNDHDAYEAGAVLSWKF